MKRAIRSVCLLLALVVLVGVFGGCGEKNAEVQEEKPSVDRSPVLMMNENPNLLRFVEIEWIETDLYHNVMEVDENQVIKAKLRIDIDDFAKEQGYDSVCLRLDNENSKLISDKEIQVDSVPCDVTIKVKAGNAQEGSVGLSYALYKGKELYGWKNDYTNVMRYYRIDNSVYAGVHYLDNSNIPAYAYMLRHQAGKISDDEYMAAYEGGIAMGNTQNISR